jgi:hypothetical protein
MLKRTGLLLTLILILAAPAGASTGARLTFPQPKHTFTLQAARSLDQRYEQHQGLGATITGCGWVRVHVAACASHFTATVIDGQAPERYTLIDYITRSGACENAGPVVRRHDGITWQKGGSHVGNCFTGPLVVVPHTIY